MLYLVLLFWASVIAAAGYFYRDTEFMQGFLSAWKSLHSRQRDENWSSYDESPRGLGEGVGVGSIIITALLVIVFAITTICWAW